MLENLLKNNFPILFEGLHTTFFLNHPKLENRKKIVRAHNIEHEYYSKLSEVEPSFVKKQYYKSEAVKLEYYEKVLTKAEHVFAISPADYHYFHAKYCNVSYIPAFHLNDKISIRKGKGDYVLYHGNLSVRENVYAILFLINKVFSVLNKPVLIAGRNPVKDIYAATKKMNNIKIIANPSDEEMNELVHDAHITLIPTFQATGLKLKLLASLFSGRFCIANSQMVHNTGLEELCSVKDNAGDIVNEINRLFEFKITDEVIANRKELLCKDFSNNVNAEKIIEFL